MEVTEKPATEKPVTIVKDANFVLQNTRIGQFISVEIANSQRESFKSHLVGCKAGSYLIVEMPSVLEGGGIKDQLTIGRQLIVRSICEKTTGECMGFYCTVEGVIRMPHPVLFISYPIEIETRELRNEKRVDTVISAWMQVEPSAARMAGQIIDLSAGGCRFELPVEEGVVKIKARNLYLRYVDPVTNQETVRLGQVCSQRREGPVLSIGFAFLSEMQQTA
jgi:hypothetical protein